MKFRSDMTVKVEESNLSDELVCRAARVSTQGGNDSEASQGLINFLMKNRHGSPFEHGSITFYVEAPIFVFREFMRHRIGFSYNEESGRYKELEGTFYVPGPSRKLVQVGKTGAYEFEEGTQHHKKVVDNNVRDVALVAYTLYQHMLEEGIAREVARMILPLNIYSSMYVTCNPRSLMNFLSLRIVDKNAMFPSFAMKEIEMVALAMQNEFQLRMPNTFTAFVKNGKVAP